MSWNKISEGSIVTWEGCTALSNIPAGTPLSLVGAVSGGPTVTQIGTLGDTVAGVSATNYLGNSFIGVADYNISANGSPVTVFTEGVFKFIIASASLDASMIIGHPVWAHSGQSVLINETANGTGDASIGTIVGFTTATVATGGAGYNYVYVKIKPAIYRWTIMNSGMAQAQSATAPEALCWPPQL